MTLHYLLILFYYLQPTIFRWWFILNILTFNVSRKEFGALFLSLSFFESGLNVYKLMHSLINNQLNRYWSKILIGITNDWTGNQSMIFSGFVSWHNFVTSHALNYNSSERLFQMFNPHASLCFILFVFFPAHFSLHRLLTIWTAAKGNLGMIGWIYHNVKLFAKKRLDMYPPTRVLYV